MTILNTIVATERREVFIPVEKSTKYFYRILINKFILCFVSCFTIAFLNSWDRFFFLAPRPNADHGPLILEVSKSHTTTHHSW
jgi:nucleoside recognition membrane protein YjiH